MDERKMKKVEEKQAGMRGQRVGRDGEGGTARQETGHCTTITLWFSVA